MDLPMSMEALDSLQQKLGHVIDLVEDTWSGCTRQVVALGIHSGMG